MPERNPHPRAMIQYGAVSQAAHDTIVAALRFWQDTVLEAGFSQSPHGWTLSAGIPAIDQCAEEAIDVATQNGSALDIAEVDALIEHLKEA